MKAKLLRHPASTSNAAFTPPVSSVTTADSGVPVGFYAGAALAILSCLVVGGPFKLIALAACWAVYLYCVVWSPERTLFVFLLTMLLIKITETRGIPLLPGLNTDTLFIASLGICAVMSRDRQPQPPPPNPLVKPIVFFTIVLVVSAILAFGFGTAMGHSLARGWRPFSAGQLFSDLKTDVFYLFLGPIAFRILWDRRQLITAVWVVGIYTLTVAAEAWINRPIDDRLAGAIFKEPNELGSCMALFIVMLSPIVISKRVGLWGRVFLVICMVAMTAALIGSLSRGAWLAVLAGFLILSVLRGAKGVILIVVLAMTATIWMPASVSERIDRTIRSDETPSDDLEFDSSTESRLERWKAVPGMYFEAPIIGHGYKSFSKTYGVLNNRGGHTGPHSSITAIIVEEGLIGMIAYVWLIMTMFLGAWRLRRVANDILVEAIATGVTAGVPTIAILDLTGNRIFSNSLMAPAFLLIGGVLRQYANVKAEESVGAVGRRRSAVTHQSDRAQANT